MRRTKERKRIAKDPFHQQILDALGRHLDAQVFEACMADLLRDVFPGLVPIPGGNDAGMDGAVADGKGEPYPLVCTTGEDVARNLTDNLEAFLKRGLSSRNVALATSRDLTPPETRALFRLAGEKGFTLLQVFERSALAFLLYRNAIWCKRLLSLTGAPSALSVVPLSRRPQVDIELRGRDEDIQWLRSTPGDRVVLGLPGSGKTSLFSSLIRSGWPALFLVSDDDTAIANAIRNQEPEVVILDDAHVAPERLDRLRRLRDEIQGEFKIVASAWPGASADLIEALGGLPESRVHNLGLLPRAQILEIFHDLDVRPRDEILRDLVSQAGNKPGLAVAIALLWRQGEWQKILDGTVLSHTLLSLFKGLTGVEVSDVLAAFSLGGRRGMSLEAVAGFFPSRDIWRIATDLGAGGVLSVVDTERLAVQPQVLRSALLRQIFFTGSPIRLDYRKLLPSVPSLAESVGEIMVARAYGAVIPTDDLHDLVLQSGSRQAWSTLVVVSEEEALWVLENYSGNLLDVVPALLHQIPQAVIPRILERAAEPTKKTGGWALPEQPMNILSSWVDDFWADHEEWIRRRRMVARAAKKFLLEGGERGVGVLGICIALSPKRLGNSLNPGRGDVLTEWRRLLPSETLRQIEPIWDEVKEAIQFIDPTSCHHLVSLLRDWYHQYWTQSAEDAAEKREFMREFACRVLRDLAARSQGSPGLHAHFGRLAEQFEISLELEQDPIFLLLYNHDRYDRNPDSRREKEAVRGEQIKTLATEWAQDDPQVVIRRIAFYEEEAKKSSGHFRSMPDFFWELAGVVQEPELWLDECLSQGLKSDLIGPFLWRIVQDRRAGWESLLNRSLGIESLQWRAATLVLELEDTPLTLLAKVFGEFSDLTTLVEQRCQNRRVPVATLRKLLQHSRWDTALAAATGEWWAEPQGEVREEVLADWRSAILRSRTDEYSDTEPNMGLQYSLGCILSGDASLSLEWLRSRLRDPDLPQYLMGDSPFAHALRALGKDQRLALLQELEPVPIAGDMIPLLIREDVEVYGQALALRRLSEYHLAPLAGLPQKAWPDLALVALQAGYEPAQIAGAAFEKTDAVVGSGIEYWEKWDLAFAEIGREGTPELQEVSRHGRKIAQEHLQWAKALDKNIDLNGLVGGVIPSGR
jgi:hypothetical protein